MEEIFTGDESSESTEKKTISHLGATRIWADAQRNGRPAEYRWRRLRNFHNSVPCPRRKVWLMATAEVPCSNAAKMRNPLKFAGVPQTTGPISAASGPKFTILWGYMEEILLLNKFFFRLSLRALIAKI